jgi:Rad3-related DNA helicase
LTYRNAGEREATLERFLTTPDAVLLAPSFERGVDLPEEACEIIIIAKVPYPYLGDKQIAAKLYSKGGKTWYAVQTIRAIVQMCGRGMRSTDDWCDTYILDAQFKKLWRDHGRLFPQWFREAVALSQTDPKYAHLIDAAEERKSNRQATREF